MKTRNRKINKKLIVFDLDETIGHFEEFGRFISGLEYFHKQKWFVKSYDEDAFDKILENANLSMIFEPMALLTGGGGTYMAPWASCINGNFKNQTQLTFNQSESSSLKLGLSFDFWSCV